MRALMALLCLVALAAPALAAPALATPASQVFTGDGTAFSPTVPQWGGALRHFNCQVTAVPRPPLGSISKQ